MTAEELAYRVAWARDLKDTRGGVEPREAFLELAELAVSVLRMIDARREAGVKFAPSYNEDQLRIALAPLAEQKFPPGPPMRAPSECDACDIWEPACHEGTCECCARNHAPLPVPRSGAV